jgi:hypothetical protein
MLPEFEGIDDWIPRPHRESLCAAVGSGAIRIERLLLPESQVASPIAARHIQRRWNPTSPLLRAASAVVGYWEQRGIDPGQGHLHGTDILDQETPYFANSTGPTSGPFHTAFPSSAAQNGWRSSIRRRTTPWIACASFLWTGRRSKNCAGRCGWSRRWQPDPAHGHRPSRRCLSNSMRHQGALFMPALSCDWMVRRGWLIQTRAGSPGPAGGPRRRRRGTAGGALGFRARSRRERNQGYSGRSLNGGARPRGRH